MLVKDEQAPLQEKKSDNKVGIDNHDDDDEENDDEENVNVVSENVSEGSNRRNDNDDKDEENISTKDDVDSENDGSDSEDDDDDDDDDDNAGDRCLHLHPKFNHFVDTYPRMSVCCFRIVIPLWLLISISLGFGHLLAIYEAPQEYISNDETVRGRYVQSEVTTNQTVLEVYNISLSCLDFYIDIKTNRTTLENNSFFNLIDDQFFDLFPIVDMGLEETSVDRLLDEITQFMDACAVIAEELVDSLSNFTGNEVTDNALTDLTFNWIRCWNSSLYGNSNPLIPSKEQVTAAANQAEFYTQSWEQDQEMLYDYYVKEKNCTEDDYECRISAYTESVDNATGSKMCSVNTGGSAWFWFTVMTTVGYGNQLPVTRQGRALVSGLGWLSIVAFGAISLSGGKVAVTIVEDLFGNCCRLKFMEGSKPGVIIWAAIAVVWIYTQSILALNWWDRVPEYVVSEYDSLWFAYISSTTVGLGDFFLQPELMFISDVFSWSFVFLIGFIMITAFLNQVNDVFCRHFPKPKKSLEERLHRTDPLGRTVDKDQIKNYQARRYFDEYADIMRNRPDDQRIETVWKKKLILIKLLALNEKELKKSNMQQSTRSRSIESVRLEEKILKKIMAKTKKEREFLEEQNAANKWIGKTQFQPESMGNAA